MGNFEILYPLYLFQHRTYIKNNMAENYEQYLMVYWVKKKNSHLNLYYTLVKNVFFSQNVLISTIYLLTVFFKIIINDCSCFVTLKISTIYLLTVFFKIIINNCSCFFKLNKQKGGSVRDPSWRKGLK